MRTGAKVAFARSLRQRLTDAETHVWFFLRRRQLKGFRFRRQHPLGPYIADFVCLERHLIIELDGSQHLDCADDMARDVWFRENGDRVLRFWNDDALLRTDRVLGMMVSHLEPAPEPFSGDGIFPVPSLPESRP